MAKAVILVHGVSAYQSLQSLEEFLKAAAEPEPGGDYDVHHRPVAGGWCPYYELDLDGTIYHFFEVLWSPETKRNFRLFRAIAWLFSAVLWPSRLTAPGSNWKKRLFDGAVVLVCLAISLGLCVVIAFCVYAGVITALAGMQKPGSAILVVYLALGAAAAWYLVHLLASTVGRWDKWWALGAVLLASCVYIWAAGWLYFEQLFAAYILAEFVPFALIGPFLLYVIFLTLRDRVADVAIAATEDINDPQAELRERVTNKLTVMLRDISEAPPLGLVLGASTGQYQKVYYEEVTLVGHSLGTVIAFDALCDCTIQWFAEEEHIPDLPFLPRLKRLITCGSPLAKIATFRGWRSPYVLWYDAFMRRKTVEAFEANDKHGGVANDRHGQLKWINFWGYLDPIADPLSGDPLFETIKITDVPLKRGQHGGYYHSEEFTKILLGIDREGVQGASG